MLVRSAQSQVHIRRLLVVSLLCLAFTAITNANIGIISQFASQNQNDWIGPLSIALLFLGSGAGALYNRYIGSYPFNRVIFAGALGWDVFIAFSVIFLYIGFEDYVVGIIAVGSLVCGLTVSLYYNGIFNYVNECGKRDSSVEKYFGINLCFNQSSNVVGNAFSWFLIEPLGQKVYSLVMMGAGEFCGGLIIALFSKRIKNLGLLFGLNSLAFLGSVGLVSLGFTEDNKQVIYGGAFVLGVTDCLCFSLALAFAGKWDERGLSMFNLGQSGTVAVLSILHIFVELQFLFMIYAAALVLTWLSVWGNRKELNERSGDVITNK